MRSMLANIWHSIGGVSISDLENSRFLFHFYFEFDVDRVEENGLIFGYLSMIYPMVLYRGCCKIVGKFYWDLLGILCINYPIGLQRNNEVKGAS
ncbi:hypothetical protein Goari_010596 [Gossypium aridum]|uniref:DUF4283 domain-containing protein n=1 Tax=Gossypium aridum TaxID=34290 RepID=A0A7J8Y0K3_GOSAI|nr:hypothetical protein [Gossypium aridum]